MSKQKQTRRRFTAEFKAETVKLVKQSDRSISGLVGFASPVNQRAPHPRPLFG
jgi:transposase-like protein